MNEIIERIELLEKRLADNSINRQSIDLNSFTKKSNSVPLVLKIGKIQKNSDNKSLIFPALIPFANSKGICIEVDETNRDIIHTFMQSLCLQIINQLPLELCKISLIDTKNLGANFRIIKNLDKSIIGNGIIVDENNIRTILDEHFNHATQIIQDYLTYHKSLSEYNIESGHTEPYRFLFISNFPYKFSKDSIDKITTLLDNSKTAGIHVILTYDKSLQVSNTNEINQLINQLISISPTSQGGSKFVIKNLKENYIFNNLYDFQLDLNITNDDIDKQVKEINKYYQKTKDENETISGISIPIGKVGSQKHNFIFGYDSNNYHAIVGGQSGMGKSVLLNNIIARGIDTYSPDELRFVLLDCKGTEFSEYKVINNNDHIQMFCSSSDVEKGIKVVQFIDDELKRREQIFNAINAKNIDDYRIKSKKVMPRLICIIDEFQVLFNSTVKNANYVESVLISRVLKVGRSFGIHLIVCTQSLGDGVRRSFLENIPLRIALGMTPEQSLNFLGMNNNAAGNLALGKAIYNPRNGDIKANKNVNVDFLSSDKVESIIQRFKSKAIKYEKFDKTKIE
jgi:hypothetical protein